jgi:hypothetical protein
VRGSGNRQDGFEIQDPLLRAIADLREQVDRLIDEQKGVVGAALAAQEEEPPVVERLPPAPGPETLGTTAAAAPVSRARKPSTPAAFDRVDDPSPTPPRPVSTAQEPAPPPPARSDDPRERLDALAKHLDRKLRQAGGPPAETPPKPSEP